MMRNLTDKQFNKIRTGIGVTVAVYLVFKYLLPLVIPFLLAGLLAWILYPCVRYLHHLFPKIKEGLIASLLLTVIGVMIGVGGWLLLGKLEEFMDKIDFYWSQFQGKITLVENFLQFPKGSLEEQVMKITNNISLPNMLEYGKKMIAWSASFFVMVIATVLFIEEREVLKKRLEGSSFYMEGRLLVDNLKKVGGSYLKVEGIILLLTIVLCSVGFYFLKIKNPIVKGIGIGVLDALPIFGTGTIFIPWIVILLFNGKWIRAVEIGILYLVCYFLREFMEDHLMGESMGITALEFLASVYVGLKLFGGAGFLLGPMGYLIIRLGMKIF